MSDVGSELVPTLDAAIKRVERAEEELAAARKNLQEIPGRFADRLKDEEVRDAVAYVLYWDFERINSSSIAEGLGIREHSAEWRRIIGFRSGKPCSVCGIPIAYTSRTNRKHVEASGSPICRRCIERRGEYYGAQREAEEEQAAEEARRLAALPYTEFLKTDYWRYVAVRARKRAGYRCELCGNGDTTLDVHHKTYEHHGWEHLYPRDLIVLCRDCHSKHHEVLA